MYDRLSLDEQSYQDTEDSLNCGLTQHLEFDASVYCITSLFRSSTNCNGRLKLYTVYSGQLSLPCIRSNFVGFGITRFASPGFLICEARKHNAIRSTQNSRQSISEVQNAKMHELKH